MGAKTTVYDVAAYIIKKRKTVTAMKLQKLVYYCQAWSVVWDDKPMFTQRIEAWVGGPISPGLFKIHEGQYKIRSLSKGDPNKLNESQKETVSIVLNYYGHRTSQFLSDLTHQEDPWIDAREGVPNGERSNKEITLASMEAYYSSLHPED